VDFIRDFIDPFGELVVGLVIDFIGLGFSRPWFAFLLFLVLFVWAGWIKGPVRRDVQAFKVAATARLRALEQVLDDAKSTDEAQLAFEASFDKIDQAFATETKGAGGLVHAWREFQESIVLDSRGKPIKNTIRPINYFSKSSPSQAKLIFWSNVFVGIGLILTFVGIVVALHVAGRGMGGGITEAQASLTKLLSVAGAKFSTSIGGVGASLWLRFAERRNSSECQALLNKICDLLERGLLYVPPQRLAVDQLNVQREQLDQLRQFNTELALQIGEKFSVAIAPVTASLGALNENIATMSQGLGQGAAKAVEEASGGELRALGHTLANLGEQLSGLSATVGSSGDDAARQIRAAGADFAQAASDIRSAFERLTSQVDTMGDSIGAQVASASQAQTDAMAMALQTAESAQQTANRSVSGAIEALSAAAVSSANRMQEGLGEALARGAETSQEVFRAALQESGAGLKAAGESISAAVRGAADEISRASTQLASSNTALSGGMDTFKLVSAESRSASDALSSATKAMSLAFAPVATTAQAMSSASDRMEKIFGDAQQSQQALLGELHGLTVSVKETQEAAQHAWLEYKERFAEVDKALASSGKEFAEIVTANLEQFRKFSGEVDTELSKAIGKIGSSLNQLEEYASALNDFVEDSKSRGERL
jgi:methyl-accepting chemotaxis protein